ncbi:cobalt transporter subunit CbtA [Natronocella acetinitrilica]|uniref:Cobalt transporter subunit CbtA n=1 Tax=Natronocella acetinitrilica TaxID=414046 RepID=A0AAE3G8Y0_9GAMM|nr:CbtA family protein [Natronocella acetinitrilica]MCP1677213.1 cobalt transporter subunit CbtA [Natronocella acetinitrilica]
MLFRQVVLYALMAGLVSGLLLTAVQFWQVIPIIQSAEHYEEALAETSAHSHAVHSHDHDHGEGLQRTGLTLLSNVLIGAGFGLVLLAAMVMASFKTALPSRTPWLHGVFWGAAGYVVFFVAPAIGLPPQIPGAEAAGVEARQLWWAMAAVCTAVALSGAVFAKSPWRWAALGLLVVPYLMGAPEPSTTAFAAYPSSMASELEVLAQRFVAATAIANAFFWLTLGLVSVWALRRIVMPTETLPVGEHQS